MYKCCDKFIKKNNAFSHLTQKHLVGKLFQRVLENGYTTTFQLTLYYDPLKELSNIDVNDWAE